MNDINAKTINFTDQNWDTLYNVVDNRDFPEREAEMIYAALTEKMRYIPFCDYLKRFLYKNAGLSGPFDEIPLTEYQSILKAAFRENNAPASLFPSSTKISAATAAWLSQKRATRGSVLILGFGLALSVDEVNDFLASALHEETLRPQDPLEGLCRFCFERGYAHPKFEQLWEALKKEGREAALNAEEKELLYSLKIMQEEAAAREAERYQVFYDLYESARAAFAFNYNRTVRRDDPMMADEITPADMERVLYATVPRDRSGNLIPMRDSSLYALFDDNRLTRQRISKLLNKETVLMRSDLITLQFFIWAQTESEDFSPKRRYMRFEEVTNALLARCGFANLYAGLPYECFLMMCLLADDPMSVYMDVWERSFA